MTVFINDDVVVYGKWEPEGPTKVAVEFFQFADYLDNQEKVMLASARLMQEETAVRFDTETDPGGMPWHPLDEEYLQSKTKSESAHPDDILQRSGELKRAATGASAWIVNHDSVFLSPNSLPFYAGIHQSGSPPGLETRHAEYKMTKSGTRSHESTGVGRGMNIPQRQFVGASEQVIDELEILLGAWVDAGMNIVVNPKTGVAQQMTEVQWPSGKISKWFGPRVF